jgi:signal transduction histidine kinase
MVAHALISSLSKSSAGRDHASEQRESSPPANQVLNTVGSALLAGVAYYIGTRIGFALTPPGQPNSTFWPPNAILLATFLLAPRKVWWTFLLAVLPAHLFAQLQYGVPLATAAGWFITNTGEALIGALCITQLAPKNKVFESVRGVFLFVIFGVLLSPLITSFLDAAAVVITGWGRNYWPLETERFWTNALAELTIVPLIVLGISNGRAWIRNATVTRCWEAGMLAIGIAAVSLLVFTSQPISPASAPALLYAPLPLLLWAAIRFGSGGLSLSVLCIALISIWSTLHGREPFPYASMQQNILSLQILFCMVAVPLLFLSAVMADARRTEKSLRDMSSSLIDAQEQERYRIARELHDDLGQELALMTVKLNGLLEQSGETLKPGLTDLTEQLSAISTTAREISHGLYPRQLEYIGLATAVKKLCEEMRRGNMFAVNLVMGNLPRQLQSSVSLCLYRVVQETFHNVMSHSQAKRVQVELGADHRWILLRIVDDGVGFEPRRATSGLGLASMRQRVSSVGGSIDICSSPMAGTRIEVRVPLHEDSAENIAGAA